MDIWLERVKRWSFITSGVFVCAFSFAVMVGWFYQYEPLLRIQPKLSAMMFNTALILFLLGLCQILILFQFKISARILSLAVTCFSALTGLQYLFNIGFGVDELFFPYNLEAPMDFPGRMALNTAVTLSLLGISLFSLSFDQKKSYSIIPLILTTLTISISGLSLFGYVTGLEAAAGWANYARMAAHTAFLSFILSLSIFLTLLSNAIETKHAKFALPFAAFVGALTGTVAVWQAFETRDFLFIKAAAEKDTLVLKYSLEERTADEALALTRMAERWSSLGMLPEALWKVDSQNYLHDFDALLGIEIYDQNLKVLQSAIKKDPDGYFLNLEKEALKKQILEKKSFVYFDPDISKIYLLIPLFKEGIFAGMLVGKISSRVLIEEAIKKLPLFNYLIIFQDINKNNIFYTSGDHQSKIIGSPIEVGFTKNLLPWKIKLYLTEASLVFEAKDLQYFIFSSGIFTGLFLILSTYFGISLIEKRKEAEKKNEELKEASQKAEEATLAKSLFLANMSHEIRTPLNAVIGTIQLLGETSIDDTQKKYVKRIENSSKNLLNLITDILDFSKLESGTVQFNIKPCSLEEIFKHSSQSLFMKSLEKNIDFLIDFPPNPFPLIKTDSHRLYQVITNLLTNAFKFTDKGYVLLRAREKHKEANRLLVRIEVEDSGIGIPKEDLGKLFKKFSQIESAAARKYGGIGLGLSICKKLIEKMGGKVGVESEVGKGTTFWAEIPFETEGSSLEERKIFPEKNVLLIDSKEKEKDILAKLATSWGLKVHFNTNAGPVQFAICPSDAMESLEKEGASLPFLLISNEEIHQLPKNAFGYVSRPFTPSELFEALKKLT